MLCIDYFLCLKVSIRLGEGDEGGEGVWGRGGGRGMWGEGGRGIRKERETGADPKIMG